MTNLAGMAQAQAQAARAGQRERPALRPGGQAGAAGPERS
jgi:ribosomal protein L4